VDSFFWRGDIARELDAERELRRSVDCRWEDTVDWPILSREEIHLWYFSLNPRPMGSLVRVLSRDELARARSIQTETGKRRFVSSRIILRSILARYLGVSPGEVSFGYSSYGKPFLAKPPGQRRMEFSLSHSKDSAVLGVTIDQAIGLDVEVSTHMPEAQALARRFFSDEESQLIQSLAENARDEAFFRIWTAREAFLKAKGIGLTQQLSEIVIPSQRVELNRFIRMTSGGRQRKSLSLSYLEPDPGLVVALVAERADSKLACWRWT